MKKILTIVIIAILFLSVSVYLLQTTYKNVSKCPVHHFLYYAKDTRTGETTHYMPFANKTLLVSDRFELYRICIHCGLIQKLEWNNKRDLTEKINPYFILNKDVE